MTQATIVAATYDDLLEHCQLDLIADLREEFGWGKEGGAGG